ncbi:MAG: hypothetical protein AAFW89_05285 [Bacteroidota bacterium]
MKKITLKRPTEGFNTYCSYDILIGGKKITDLSNGEEKTIELQPHQESEILEAKIQWCGSQSYAISDASETGTLLVSGNELLNRKIPLIGALFPLSGILLFTGDSMLAKTIVTSVLMLVLLGIIGTLTIWKNNWLTIDAD